MDELAFRTGNILVGNPETMEGIEMVLLPGMPAVSLLFFAGGVVAVTGRKVHVTVDGKDQDMWARTVILRGENLKIEAKSREDTGGFRVYICIKGGFPHVPVYLGSKSTSVGLGGYQVNVLTYCIDFDSKIPSREEISSREIILLLVKNMLQPKTISVIHDLFHRQSHPTIHQIGLYMYFRDLSTMPSMSLRKASPNSIP